jgi:hypothetical protein
MAIETRNGVAPFGRGCVALAICVTTIRDSAPMANATGNAILRLENTIYPSFWKRPSGSLSSLLPWKPWQTAMTVH